MSILRCDDCDKPVDTDQVDMETFPCGEDDSFKFCPACAERIEAQLNAEMSAARAEYDAAPLSERNPAEYRRNMIDAGHGHLLHERWEE